MVVLSCVVVVNNRIPILSKWGGLIILVRNVYIALLSEIRLLLVVHVHIHILEVLVVWHLLLTICPLILKIRLKWGLIVIIPNILCLRVIKPCSCTIHHLLLLLLLLLLILVILRLVVALLLAIWSLVVPIKIIVSLILGLWGLLLSIIVVLGILLRIARVVIVNLLVLYFLVVGILILLFLLTPKEHLFLLSCLFKKLKAL